MGRLIGIALVLVIAAMAWSHWMGNRSPENFDNPMYLEYRIDLHAGSRVINSILWAEASDMTDCEGHALQFWLRNLGSCKNCEFRDHHCSREVPARYRKLFSNQPMDITYLRAVRGARDERSGWILLWGLDQQESDKVCDDLVRNIRPKYTGVLECVRPRR